MCDGSGAASWAHDSMGRVLTEQRIINGTSAVNKKVQYSYYKDGELNTLTYPGSSRVITYTANTSGGFSAGRPVSAVDNANSINYVTSATYAPQGALASLTNGAAIMGAFSYNSRLQPLQMFYGTNSPPSLTGSTCPSTVGNILHRVYSFNVGTSDNGDVISIANCRDTNRTQSFTYDSLNRIKTAATQGATCTACWGQMFGYMSGSTFVPGIDAWGNLFQITATQGSTTTLTQTVSNNNQFVGMTYDAAGNLINDGAGHTYTFDDENRLTATAGYTYVYDGDGKRVKKCSNSGCTSGTIYWAGTGSDAISEAGVAGSVTEEYIFFNSRRVARRDASGGAVHYYFSDHLGSASVVTDNSGNIQKESDYYPFGGEVVVTGGDINNYKFTGKERDSESNLDMFGARYYGSSLGRFMTPDWAAKPVTVPYAHFGNPQSLNLYSYVSNNPTTTADPDGHCPWCLAVAGGGILADEAPLAFTGPVGWTIMGVTALGVTGYAAYQHFHNSDNSNAAPASTTPAPGATTEQGRDAQG
jgi:RHS repeat-associated protein